MIALMQQRRVLAALAVTATILGFGLPASASTGGSSSTAGRFIVQLRDGVDAPSTAAEYRRAGGSEIDYVYTAALDGFAGSFSNAALGELESDGRVVRIERDAAVHATTEQTGATWGIDRIDQTPLPLNGTYNYATTASNVTAFIIDTGIRFSHSEFGGRAVSGYDAVDGGSADDCNGHGTHVAGTVGGSTYGVAKQVHLVAVRVLNCQGSGTWSGVAAGIDWVTGHHTGPSVANMSLGGGISSIVDTALDNSINSGVTYAVAAGNSSADACNYSPAHVAAALTIGATTSSDAQASYSNYGGCVDLYAPGSSVTSSWNTSDTATNTISGTSMATPHVTGGAALYLADHPSAAPADVANALEGDATNGVITSLGSGSPNLLLRVNKAYEPPATPTASISKSCSGASCTFTGSGSYGAASVSGYGWAFGDTGTGSGSPISHDYTTAGVGTYTVNLTVSFTGTFTTATASTPVKCQSRKVRGTYRLVCS